MLLNIKELFTYFVLAVDLFEVDFVELVVLLEDFTDIGLPYLLQIDIEVFVIEIGHEVRQQLHSFFKIFIVFCLDFRMTKLLYRDISLMSKLGKRSREERRMQFLKV
jgi:hypothetical protein